MPAQLPQTHLHMADSEADGSQVFRESDSSVHSLEMAPPQLVLGSLADQMQVHPIKVHLKHIIQRSFKFCSPCNGDIN